MADVRAMSNREVLQLVFLPGLSTAEKVTHISGRGVGMDVIRANVEAVGGSVELESCKGFGTKLQLRVPLTLAIMPALIVRSAGEIFALPQSSVTKVIHVTEEMRDDSVHTAGSAEYFRMADCSLPIVWLDRLLASDYCSVGAAREFYLHVVDSDGCRFGLAVDDVLAREEIIVKPVSEALRQADFFAGATVCSDGDPALILNIAALGTRAQNCPQSCLPGNSMTFLEEDDGRCCA